MPIAKFRLILYLNIDSNTNTLDFDLAKSVCKFFQHNEKQMIDILKEV